jgi:hypothetical protein
MTQMNDMHPHQVSVSAKETSSSLLGKEIAFLEQKQAHDKIQLKSLIHPASESNVVSDAEEGDDQQIDDDLGHTKHPSSSQSSEELVISPSSSNNSVDTSRNSNETPSTLVLPQQHAAVTTMKTPEKQFSVATYIRSSGSAPPSDISWLQVMPGDDENTQPIAIPDDNGAPSIETQLRQESSDPPGKKITFVYQNTSSPSAHVEKQSETTKTAPATLQCACQLSDPALREETHARWHRFESSRQRSEMARQLDIQRNQWCTAREIMAEAVESLDLAERIISGYAKAGMLFAANLQATAEDKFLDDQGKNVTSNFSQKRLSKSRNSAHSIDSGMEQSPILNAILKCQAVLAEQATSFEDNSRHMMDHILPTIQELKSHIQENVKEAEEHGENIMKELDLSETELLNAWGKLPGYVMEIVIRCDAETLKPSLILDTGTFDSLGPDVVGENAKTKDRVESPKGRGVEDGWLAEQSYKLAVSHEIMIISHAEDKLDNIYKKVASIEALRLRKLRSILQDDFFQQQLNLFKNLASYENRLLEDLEGFRVDQESVEQILQDRSRSHLKHSQSHRSSIINRSSLNLTDLSEEDVIPGIEIELGTPLESSTVLLAEVVELRTSGGIGSMMSASWKRTIAVVTKQGNVVLLELPKQKDPAVKQSLSQAFQTLCPNIEFESSSAWSNRRKRELIRDLNPMLSWTLRKCSVDISQIQNKIVEVTEQGGQHSIKGLFRGGGGNQRDANHTLRFHSAADASKWVGEFEKTKGKLGAGSEARPGLV